MLEYEKWVECYRRFLIMLSSHDFRYRHKHKKNISCPFAVVCIEPSSARPPSPHSIRGRKLRCIRLEDYFIVDSAVKSK